MVKTRMQLKSEARTAKMSTLGTAIDLFKTEGGLIGFYKGLGSALMRQVVYATLRMGIFYSVLDVAKDKYNHPLNPLEKAGASLCVGAIAAMAANPFDLALIRFQADGTLPVNERRNYKNFADALVKIIKSEGFFNLWRGATPAVTRAMAINLGILIF
jgi:solute carrier family 25 oxoglutarate transporter 11